MTESEVVNKLLDTLYEMSVGWPQDEWDVKTNCSIGKLKKYLKSYKEKPNESKL